MVEHFKLYLHFNANKGKKVDGNCKFRCQFPIINGSARFFEQYKIK